MRQQVRYLEILDTVAQANVYESAEIGEVEAVAAVFAEYLYELNRRTLSAFRYVKRRSENGCEQHVYAVIGGYFYELFEQREMFIRQRRYFVEGTDAVCVEPVRKY